MRFGVVVALGLVVVLLTLLPRWGEAGDALRPILYFPTSETALQFIPAPNGSFGGPVWIADGRIATICYPKDGGLADSRLVTMGQAGSDLRYAGLVGEADCLLPHELFAAPHPVGGVGLIQACSADSSLPRRIVAYEPTTNLLNLLAMVPTELYLWSFGDSDVHRTSVLNAGTIEGKESL